MDCNSLIQIIRREISDVSLFIGESGTQVNLSSFEISIVASKIKNIGDELDLLMKLSDNQANTISSLNDYGNSEANIKEIPLTVENLNIISGNMDNSELKIFEKPEIEKIEIVQEIIQEQKVNDIAKVEPTLNENDSRLKGDSNIKTRMNQPEIQIIEHVEHEKNGIEPFHDVVIPDKNRIPSQPAQVSSVADRFSSEKKSLNDKLSNKKGDSDLASKLSSNPIQDMRSAISLNEKLLFTKALFSSKSNKYNEVVEKINSATGFDDAKSIFLNSLSNVVDEEVKSAFINIIMRRFS